jgi:HPt (histidine-containing phosphotransfer) domain-containing protein
MRVDRTVLESLRDFQEEGEPDVVKELFDTFISFTPRALENSEQALLKEDWTTLSRSMHQLKSQSGGLGARRMMALCGEAELVSRQSPVSLDLLKDLFEKIKKEYFEVEQELRRLIG